MVRTTQNGVVRAFDVATGVQIGKSLQTGYAIVRAVAVSSGGIVAISGEDAKMAAWELATGERVSSDLPVGKASARVIAAGTHDGRSLVAASSDDNLVRAWSIGSPYSVGIPVGSKVHAMELWAGDLVIAAADGLVLVTLAPTLSA